MKPHFKHDCPSCIFLGTHFFPYNQHTVWDLYIHLGKFPALIARHGSDGSYVSFDIEVVERLMQIRPKHILIEAYTRAKQLNLIAA